MTTVPIELPSQYRELFNPHWRNIVYYGGRGSGKSQSVARALLIIGRQSRKRYLCTREYQKSIKDSVHKLLSDLINKYGLIDYEVQKQGIYNRITGTEFIFAGLHNNVAEIKSMEGIDAAWCEEAQSLSDESLDVLSPTIRKPGSQLIFTFNRQRERDPVYVRYVMKSPPKTYAKQVNYDALKSLGWFPDVLEQERLDDKANYPSIYAHKWLGEPINESDMALISRDKIDQAFVSKEHHDGDIVLGADIARFGGDRTAIVVRNGNRVVYGKILEGRDTQVVAREIIRLAEKYHADAINVDETGVGGGVVDAIRLEREVTGINFGERPKDPTKYLNWISESWFNLAENIADYDLSWFNDQSDWKGLPDELAGREWRVGAGGKSAVQSNDEFKKAFGRSPDLADALILAFGDKPHTVWASADDLL